MPLDSEHSVEEPATPSQRLTNDDFRKLLMTPRAPPGSAHASGSVREAMANSRYGFHSIYSFELITKMHILQW